MSAITKRATGGSGPLPPDVPLTFIGDIGNATAAANTMNVPGGETSDDNAAGIQTNFTGNTMTFELTNRIRGNVQTTDGSTVTLASFSLGATPAAYAVQGKVVGYIPASDAGGGYFFEGTLTTDGATANLVGGQFTSFQEDTAIEPAFVNITVSGNNFIIQITGIAATTINWNCLFDYIKV